MGRRPVHEQRVLEILERSPWTYKFDSLLQSIEGSHERLKCRWALNALLEEGKVIEGGNGELGIKTKPKPSIAPGQPRVLSATNNVGRATAAEHPIAALRTALQCPYPKLRRAAVEVLREAILNTESTTAAAAALSVTVASLWRLKRDFPQEWADACHRTSSKLAQFR